MAEEQKISSQQEEKEKKNSGEDNIVKEKKNTDKSAAQAVAKSIYGKKADRKGYNKGYNKREERKEEFDQQIIDLARVTRVMAGGKRMRFRACVAIGNKKGDVGIGLAKGADVSAAVSKAVNKARKKIINVPIVNNTIPHEVYMKSGAAKIILKPARKGRGIIAGGAVRIILELSGIKNVTSKILGTNNKINNVKCAIAALKSLRRGEIKFKNNQLKEENVL